MFPIVRIAWLAFLLAPLPSAAQSVATPAMAIELVGGYAGFVDEALINHAVMGGVLRIPVLPRVSVGPEITYMIGPYEDRDLFVMGAIYFDFRAPAGAPAVAPYVVGSGGLMRHHDRFGALGFVANEGAFTGGAGARVRVTDRIYVAPEFRIGWEAHMRITTGVGIALR